MATKPRVLVVDDEESIRTLLKARLIRDGFHTEVASNGVEAIQTLSDGQETAVVVTDIKMPGQDGFQLLESARPKIPNARWVMITGHGEKQVAIQALREGATDYLEKPFDMDELSHSVGRAMREYRLQRENQELMERLEARAGRAEGTKEDETWYVSRSASMSKVNEWLQILQREAMRGEAEEPTVLLLGESGTGKEGIARMVHASSRRGKGPWIAVNCANFSEQLLESELFGHERGAFTGAHQLKKGLFEIAKGGTLFLDELGEMDVKLQARLLRVLQERTFRRVGGTVDLTADVRVVAATHRNLEERVRTGEFREDLFHRISRVVVEIPALRDRKDDILPMAKHFAVRAFQARGKTFEGFTSQLEDRLLAYNWPGNVRELLNAIERAALVWEGHGTVSAADMSIPLADTAAGANMTLLAAVRETPREGYMTLKKQWQDSFEREYLSSLLKRHSGNVSAASREAKLDRSNFLRLLRRHSIRALDFRKAGVRYEDDVA